jgi:hypothetical protein
MIAEDQHLLLWKGRQFGPFSVDQIREKLSAGDINRMHQIKIDGRWQILDEYLERLRGAESEAKRQMETQLDEERAPLSHLIPKAAPPPPLPAFRPSFTSSPGSPSDNSEDYPGSDAPPPPFPMSQSRMSGFAITALVLGLVNCGFAVTALLIGVNNFIPFVGLVLWILALVFGHIGLSQMKTDETLKGRGMAIAGLAITYFLLVTVTTLVVLFVANNKPLPFHP